MFGSYNTFDMELDKAPVIQAYEDTKKLATGPVRGIALPEPVTLLAKMASVKEAALKVAQPDKKVPLVMPKVSLLDDPWFKTEPKYESTEPVVEAAPKKKGWFASFTDKIGEAVESFGNFLNRALPAVSAAALAVTLGGVSSQLNDFNQVKESARPVPVQMSTSPKSVQVISPVVKAESTEMNKTADQAGSKKTDYLYSQRSHAHFISQLEKWGGYRTVLDHPRVKEAKTTAEMINLVEKYFGEKVADLIEFNVKAMHQPAHLCV